MRLLHSCASALAIAALTIAGFSTANAADRLEERMAPNPMTGNLSVWGAAVIPSGYNDQFGDECTNGGGPNHFCEADFGFGGDLRAHYDMGNGNAFQFEALLDYHRELDSTDSSDDEHAFHAAAVGHLIRRTGQMAYGAFVGVSGTGHLDQDDRSVHGLIGLEAAMIRGDKTFFGQVGYAGALSGDDEVDDLFFGRAGVRHFFDPNRRLEGSIAGGFSDTAEKGDLEDLRWLQVAANYEQKFEDSPYSWFVGYQGDYVDVPDAPFASGDSSVFVHTILAGFRITLGETDTLQQQDNYGARTFDLTNLRAPLSYPDEL